MNDRLMLPPPSIWKDLSFPSKIEDILKKENFTLQELLDEDGVVADTTHHNVDLIRFLSKEENIKQLLTYVTSYTPPETASTKEKFRYPVVAYEILLSDNIEFQEPMVSPSSLSIIYSFFNNPTLDLQRASLVIRIAIHLLQFRLKECITFLRGNPQALLDLISHPEAIAVSTFIIRLIHCERDEVGILNWMVDIGVVTQLIGLFRAPSIAIHSDACNCVLDVISGAVGTPIIDAFLSRNNCSILIGYMKESPSSLRYGLNVFISLLKYIGDIPAVNYLSDIREKPATPTVLTDLPDLIQVIIDNFPFFTDLLKLTESSPPEVSENTTKNNNNFGYVRLRLIQMLTMLLSLNFMLVNNFIFESDILTISVDLILAFPHHTIAHQAIESLWAKIFEIAEPESCVKILNKTSLIKRLILAEEENTASERGGKPRKPYMPYLHQLAFTIQSLTQSEVKSLLDQTEGWEEYIRIVELTSIPSAERQRRGSFMFNLQNISIHNLAQHQFH